MAIAREYVSRAFLMQKSGGHHRVSMKWYLPAVKRKSSRNFQNLEMV